MWSSVLILLTLCFISTSAWRRNPLPSSLSQSSSQRLCNSASEPQSTQTAQRAELQRTSKGLQAIFFSALSTTLLSKRADAGVGGVKPSSLPECKLAVASIKHMLEKLESMPAMAAKEDYVGIAAFLSEKDFTDFDKAAQVLVRSENLTPDEKVALGTIKRYGVVADAIIMVGGLGAALKAGGIKVGGGGSSLQQSIEDDEEEVDPADLKVDPSEIRKYIKLSRDSLGDVYKIVAPIAKL